MKNVIKFVLHIKSYMHDSNWWFHFFLFMFFSIRELNWCQLIKSIFIDAHETDLLSKIKVSINLNDRMEYFDNLSRSLNRSSFEYNFPFQLNEKLTGKIFVILKCLLLYKIIRNIRKRKYLTIIFLRKCFYVFFWLDLFRK